MRFVLTLLVISVSILPNVDVFQISSYHCLRVQQVVFDWVGLFHTQYIIFIGACDVSAGKLLGRTINIA